MNKVNTRKITISAMLTALSLVYIIFMPTFDLGVWSFTPFSHMPLFIACFISPYTGIMTYVAVLLGFIIKGTPYLVWLRAASHLFFVVFIILYIKIRGIKTKKDIAITATVTSIIHAGFEILAVLLGMAFALPGTYSAYYILVVVGLGTMGHNLLDFFTGLFLYKAARVEKILKIENEKN